jgi:hypothetical protein
MKKFIIFGGKLFFKTFSTVNFHFPLAFSQGPTTLKSALLEINEEDPISGLKHVVQMYIIGQKNIVFIIS